MKIRKAAGAAALTLVATTALTAASEAATPGQVVKGPGWILRNANGTTSLAPVTYTIVFDSVAARTRLTPYMKAAAWETQRYTPGTKFVVSTIVRPMNKTGCQNFRTISVSLEYRPAGVRGMSQGASCWALSDHTLHSGKMRIDTEWWYPNWFSTSAAVTQQSHKNGILHEMGHAIGLGHPNTDLDRDGRVEDYECVRNRDGWRPLLCSPAGGWYNTNAGKYTPMDVAGLTALVRNYRYR